MIGFLFEVEISYTWLIVHFFSQMNCVGLCFAFNYINTNLLKVICALSSALEKCSFICSLVTTLPSLSHLFLSSAIHIHDPTYPTVL